MRRLLLGLTRRGLFPTLACLTIAARPLAAHGPAPAAVGLLDRGPGRPPVIQLSVGFAAHDGTAWRFLCPALWGGPDAALAVATADALYVFGESSLVRIDLQRAAATIETEPLTSAAARDVDGGGGESYAIFASGGGSEVWHWSDAGLIRIYTDESPSWSALVRADQQLVMGRLDANDALHVGVAPHRPGRDRRLGDIPHRRSAPAAGMGRHRRRPRLRRPVGRLRGSRRHSARRGAVRCRSRVGHGLRGLSRERENAAGQLVATLFWRRRDLAYRSAKITVGQGPMSGASVQLSHAVSGATIWSAHPPAGTHAVPGLTTSS